MLDTYGRKYVNPIIDFVADLLLSINLKPNTVTFIAFIIGIITLPLIILEKNILAVLVLWISGLLDAVDGSMARKINGSSSIGSLMDITFDRIVELCIIIGLAFKYPNAQFSMILLLSSILISMTIFLTVGATAENKGIKSFHYQAGIAERTEGFIMFSLMIIFNNYLVIIAGILTFMIFITIIQRSIEAYRLLK